MNQILYSVGFWFLLADISGLILLIFLWIILAFRKIGRRTRGPSSSGNSHGRVGPRN